MSTPTIAGEPAQQCANCDTWHVGDHACGRNSDFIARMNAMIAESRTELQSEPTREERLRTEYEQWMPSFEAWLRDIRPDIVRAALTPELKEDIKERDGYACQTCGSGKFLTVDHIFPVCLGGDNDPENLQTLCRSCNSRKGART